jgi:hypothetical protein
MEDLAHTIPSSQTLTTPAPQRSSNDEVHKALELLAFERSCSADDKRKALSLVREAQGFSESVNREISTVLLTVFLTSPELKKDIIHVANDFVKNNPSSLEACRLAVALLGFKETPLSAHEALRHAISQRISQPPSMTGESSTELKGFCRLLIESLNISEIQQEVLASIHQLLSVHPRELNPHRTLLAREVLHLFRTHTIPEETYAPLKDLAGKLYILGAAHSRARVQSLSRLNYAPVQCEESAEEKHARAARLLPVLVDAASNRQILRLSIDDFRAIATLQGLSQSNFKAVATSIVRDALVDNSALSALLSLVKSSHDESVTMQIRTSCLATLMTEARRTGKLSQTLEQRVLATSAELPHLHSPSEESTIDSSALTE